MRGQRVLFVGGQGPVSAPAARLLARDNAVFAMARFSNPQTRERLEGVGIHCITHDLLDPFDGVAREFGYVFHSAIPASAVLASRRPWPDSFDVYADATGRLMEYVRGVKGFVFASSISVYDPPGGNTPVPETHPFGIHAISAYSFTKVATEAVVSHLSRSLNVPTTIM